MTKFKFKPEYWVVVILLFLGIILYYKPLSVKECTVGIPENIQGFHSGHSPVSWWVSLNAVPTAEGARESGPAKV